MKAAKLREITKEEIADRSAETQRELLNLRIRKGSGTIEKPSRLRTLRRDIARMKTLQREAALTEARSI